MTRLTLLDLFCGAGGAARGYQEAGFHVTGVDNRPQPRYAGDVFVQADALDYCRLYGRDFDFVHASPPCQAHTPLRALQGDKEYPDLIAPTRVALIATGRPWVIENVPGAPLIEPLILCGQSFGLALYRHRLFECSFLILSPPHERHRHRASGSRGPWEVRKHAPVVTVTGNSYPADRGREAMGVPWMVRRELSQAIPPAYTRFIGEAWREATQ